MNEVDRFLTSPALSDATRRSYRFDVEEFVAWLDARKLAPADLDTRRFSEYAAPLASPRSAAATLVTGVGIDHDSLLAADQWRPVADLL